MILCLAVCFVTGAVEEIPDILLLLSAMYIVTLEMQSRTTEELFASLLVLLLVSNSI